MDSPEDRFRNEPGERISSASSYWFYLVGYFVLCFGATATNLIAFCFVLMPVPVAVYCAQGKIKKGAGFIGAAALVAGILTEGSLSQMGSFGAIAASGIFIGLGIALGRSYGTIVAAVVCFGLIVAAFFALSNVNTWEQWGEEERARVMAHLDELKTQGSEEFSIAQKEFQLKLLDSGPHVMFGAMVIPLLLLACCTLSLTKWWMERRLKMVTIHGGFTTMRPPDWAAWVAILVALLWFGDRQWSNSIMRFLSWNGGITLAVIYWLNGLGVVLYGLGAWKPHPAIYVGILFVVFNVQYVFIPLGLFDTWGEFRTKIDGALAARRAEDSGPNNQ